MSKVKVIKDNENLNDRKKEKKKHKRFSWGKLFVWVALIAMIGSAILAIISPLLYGVN